MTLLRGQPPYLGTRPLCQSGLRDWARIEPSGGEILDNGVSHFRIPIHYGLEDFRQDLRTLEVNDWR